MDKNPRPLQGLWNSRNRYVLFYVLTALNMILSIAKPEHTFSVILKCSNVPMISFYHGEVWRETGLSCDWWKDSFVFLAKC